MSTPVIDMLSRIAPQPKSLLYIGLIDLFNEIRRPQNIHRSKELLAAVSALIQKQTNLNNTVHIATFKETTSPNAMVVFEPMPNILSYPMLDLDQDRKAYTALYEHILKEPTYGTIDLKTGKVGGWYSKRPVSVVMNPAMVYGKDVTAPMIAAAILHELGHIFAYFTTLHRVLKCAHLSSESTHEILGTPQNELRHLLLRKGVPDPDVATPQEALVKMNKVHIDRELSMFSRPSTLHGYDSMGWEQLSDDFAARHGAAVDLAQFLTRFPSGHDVHARRKDTRGFLGGCKVAMTMALMSLVPSIAPDAKMVPLYVSTNLDDDPKDSMYHDGDADYDHLKDRIRHLRNTITIFLKDPLLPEKDRQEFVKQYDEITESLEEVNDPKNETSIYWLYLKRDTRLRSTLSQRQLNTLFHNDLYVTSARFKNLISNTPE